MTDPSSRALDLSEIRSELESITDPDARRDRARQMIPIRRVPTAILSQWRDALKEYGGLNKGEFDKTYREAQSKRPQLRVMGTDESGPTADYIEIPSTRKEPLYVVPDGSGGFAGIDYGGTVLASVPHVCAVLAVRDAEGMKQDQQYLLAVDSVPNRPRIRITDVDLISGAYISKLGAVVPEDRAIRDAIVTHIRMVAAKMAPIDSVARWENDRLVMPPREVLPAGYLETAGDSDSARELWRELCEIATRPGAENLALNIGASVSAPYIRPIGKVRPISYAMVGVGMPRRGKTTCVNAAAAIYGAPIRINPPLSESAIAFGDQLASLGCFPLFRDEVDSAKWTPNDWHAYWSRSLNGAGRRRSSSDGMGNVRSTPDWWGVQFMSGNVDPRFNATDGILARVIVLGDPHMPDRETARRVTAIIGECYGWPIRWIIDRALSPAQFKTQYLDEVVAALVETAAVGSAQTVAESLAMAVGGAALLGDIIGAPGLRGAALLAARRALGTLADSMEGVAVAFHDQLLADVWASVREQPMMWPSKSDYCGMRATGGILPPVKEGEFRQVMPAPLAQVHGMLHIHNGKTVASMLPSVYKRLAVESTYATDQAMAQLLEQGLAVCTVKNGHRHKIKINGNVEAFYTFREIPDTNDGTDADPTVVPTVDNDPAIMSAVTAPAPIFLPQGDTQGFPAAAATPATGPAPGPASATPATGPAPGPASTTEEPPVVVPAAAPTVAHATAHARARRGTMHPAEIERQAARDAALTAALDALTNGERLRLLDALVKPFAPTKTLAGGRRRDVRRTPSSAPGIQDSVLTITGWNEWTRPYSGKTVTLDRSGSWIASAASAVVPFGEWEHTGDDEFTGRPGYYKVDVYPWTESESLPHPLLSGKPTTVWVPAPTVELLRDLEKEGRWPSTTILDSYTSEGIRLNQGGWATDYVNQLRSVAITAYGRDSDEYATVKSSFGTAMSLMLGQKAPGHRREWNTKMCRPDWTHTVQAHASAMMFRWADDCRKVCPELAPVALQHMDELVIPAEALPILTSVPRSGDRPPMRIDPTGITLGTFKVKGESE